MATYIIQAKPTKYALRPITQTAEGVKAKNKWIKAYKQNGWLATATLAK